MGKLSEKGNMHMQVYRRTEWETQNFVMTCIGAGDVLLSGHYRSEVGEGIPV